MSNKIPEEVIAAVLKHHDIVETVGKYVHLMKQGRNYKGLCPFHSEKTSSFTVSPEKQIFRCFGCGAGGHVIKFVMDIEGYSFPEAVRHMAKEAQISVQWEETSVQESEEQKEFSTIIAAHELAVKIYNYVLKNSVEGHAALEYLRARGFTDHLIEEFQIGYAPASWDTLVRYLAKNQFDSELMEKGGLISAKQDHSGYVDRFRDRIMFPIHNNQGKPIALSGRIVGEGQPKYLNSPETPVFNKSRTLFNLHRARSAIRKSGVVVIFEGFGDVIRAWEAGTENGVATMGTALTEWHARIIRRLAEQVIVCYDGDQAGLAAAYKSLDLLEKEGCSVSVAQLPDGLDPDDYIAQHGKDAFQQHIIQSAVPATKYRLIYLRRSFPARGDEGRLKYIQAALKIIAELQSPTEREFYLRELSVDFQYTMEALHEQLHQLRQQSQNLKRHRDKNEIPWNNVMQGESGKKGVPSLLPAYHNAERKLLTIMMEDREVAMYVQEHLADQFHVEAHAAIAAYLYAYYAQGNEPDPSRFITRLEDESLVNIASAMLMTETGAGIHAQVIDDYIREIKKYPKQQAIRQKKEDQSQAMRSGDMLRAAQIGMEIISLEKELKSI
ncbi:MAG: DNA primase [Paenibacillaceae bacterium]